jgi:hypothetical protein
LHTPACRVIEHVSFWGGPDTNLPESVLILFPSKSFIYNHIPSFIFEFLSNWTYFVRCSITLTRGGTNFFDGRVNEHLTFGGFYGAE